MKSKTPFALLRCVPSASVCRIVLIASLLVATTASVSAAPLPARGAEDIGTRADSQPYLVIENVGQFAPEVRFMLTQGNRRVWLSEDAVWLDVPDHSASAKPGDLAAMLAGRAPRRAAPKLGGTALRFAFRDANKAAALEPFGRLATRVSYLIGEPSLWREDVPAWSGVRYRDLYPGIDLVVGDDAAGAVPWRLEAGPGADLAAVKLRVEGAVAESNANGALQFELAGQTVSVGAPSWSIAGEPAVLVTALATEEGNAFALAPSETAAPAAAPQDGQGLAYSRVLGGAAAELGEGGRGIALDAAGNAYVTGATSSASFPGVSGHYDPSYNGATDAFVAKLSPDGSQIVYATYLGGTGEDRGTAIAVSSDVAYITGKTSSVSFLGDATNGQMDAFVASLSADGNTLLYSSVFGGSADDTGAGIAVQGGEAYMAGIAGSGNLAGIGCGAIGGANLSDALVVRLKTDGTPHYVLCFGGSDVDMGADVAVANGVAYIVGTSWSNDIWPSTPTPLENDILLAAISSSGVATAATLVGGAYGDEGTGIAVSVNASGSGSIYAVGSTNSDNFALAGSRAPERYDLDAVVVRFAAPALTPNYASYLGGTGVDLGQGIAVDAAQKLYLAGATTSTDFPVTANAYDSSGGGSTDAFVARLDLSVTASNKVTYASYLGAAGEDAAAAIDADNSNNAFVTGSTNGQGFPVTVGSAVTGEDQAFVAKFSLTTALDAPVVTISASPPDVVLAWNSVAGATSYEVYRSGAPYFKPGDPGSAPLPGPATSPYHDPGALTAPGSYFYVVRSVGAPGVTSFPSNQVGKFTFALVKGG